MNDQTILLRSIWFITGAPFMFIFIKLLPPIVPVFSRRKFWSVYPTMKKSMWCSHHQVVGFKKYVELDWVVHFSCKWQKRNRIQERERVLLKSAEVKAA
jgi:hypothetical protein